jgi:hypothetical protein
LSFVSPVGGVSPTPPPEGCCAAVALDDEEPAAFATAVRPTAAAAVAAATVRCVRDSLILRACLSGGVSVIGATIGGLAGCGLA